MSPATPRRPPHAAPAASPHPATRPPLDPVFSALADGTRREVIEALAGEGAATATELSRRFPVSRQAIAKHLHALSQAGLVDVERAGREARWRLTPAPFTDAMRWLADVGGAWDERLAALERDLAEHRAAAPSQPAFEAEKPGAAASQAVFEAENPGAAPSQPAFEAENPRRRGRPPRKEGPGIG